MRLAVFVFALLGFASATISDCSNGASVFRPTELNLVPDPVTAGETLYMTVKFNNPGPEVTDGTVKTTLSVNYIPLSPSEEALCTNTECPLVTGLNDRSTSSVWPTGVTGKIDSRITWTGINGEQLLCLKTTINSK